MSLRRTYVKCPDTGKWVEKRRETRKSAAPNVISDIEPYRVVGPEYGKVISSRSKHREYLRKHNLVEVGNEKPKWMNSKA